MTPLFFNFIEYVHKYINATCSLCIWLVYMFSGLVIWYWITNWCFLICRKLFLLIISYLPVVLSVSGGLLSVPPSPIKNNVILIQVIVRQSWCWDFMDIVYDIIKRHLISDLIFTFLLLLFHNCIWTCIAMCGCYPLWLSCTLLYFDLLWFSILVSVYYKEKFPWERNYTYLWLYV